MWKLLAKFCAIPWIANAIINYSKKEPYLHIGGYMNRWWVFNPYELDHTKSRWGLPFSIRVHHILREDLGRDQHDHPWNARTIILKGWYIENRMGYRVTRNKGDTASLKATDYHHIEQVSPGGVYTLFFTGPYKHTWGFLVNGTKVPHNEYT